MTEADGSQKDYDEKAGDYWGEFSPLHDTLTIGATPYIAVLVEVKGASAAAKVAAIQTARGLIRQ